MALNFQGYGRDPGEEIRRRWSGSIDGIFDAYMAAKDKKEMTGRQDRAEARLVEDRAAEQGRRASADIEKFGFDTSKTTPQMWERASRPQVGTNYQGGTVGANEQRPASTIPGGPEDRSRQSPLAMGPSQSPTSDWQGPTHPIEGSIRAYLEKRNKANELGMREKSAGIAKDEAQASLYAAQAKKEGMAADPNSTDSKAENELRDELNKMSQPFTQVRDSIGRIRAAAKNPSAAGDLALIFNYMKVLDPGSTVREGEFATAQNSAGLPERMRAQYNSVINGERLAQDQRMDFVNRAEDLYSSQAAIQKQQENEYRRLAKNRRANPENVVINRNLPERAPAPAGGDAESIRAAFKAGKISREQARAQISALGGIGGR